MSTGETETQDTTTPPPVEGTATETPEAVESTASEKKKKLNLAVEIQDAGQCRRRIKIIIPPEDIQAQFHEQYTELVRNAEVPGFRAGHAPRRLIEKKYHKEVADQVKRKLLMESLEQVGEEHEIHAISEPKLDVNAIEVPMEGPMVYELEVEVTPEFELPNYKGLKIRRPIKEFGEADVNRQLQRFLQEYGQLVPKDGPAEPGDYLVADILFRDNGEEIGRVSEVSVRLQPILRFRDGTVDRFDKAMRGVQAGETRHTNVLISSEAPNVALRGRTIDAEFDVKDVKRLRLPELNAEFLEKVGYETEEQLRDALHSVLRRRLEYEQKRVARQQLLDQLTSAVDLDLPQDLVKRQVDATLRRKVMEMREAGYSEDEIRRRFVELQQNSLSATRQSLREHFILAKIADAEELAVKPDDIENQIQVIALRSDESPRKVRARLEKEGLTDTLEVQILEHLAVERILEFAEFENVPFVDEEVAEEAVDQAAAAGETAEEPAEAASAAPDSPTP